MKYESIKKSRKQETLLSVFLILPVLIALQAGIFCFTSLADDTVVFAAGCLVIFCIFIGEIKMLLRVSGWKRKLAQMMHAVGISSEDAFAALIENAAQFGSLSFATEQYVLNFQSLRISAHADHAD